MYNCAECSICYNSRMGFYKHNKKFHKDKIGTVGRKKIENKRFFCSICRKEFNHNQNKWLHEQTCKQKNIQNNTPSINQPKPSNNITITKLDKIESQLEQIAKKLANNDEEQVQINKTQNQIPTDYINIIGLNKITNQKIKEWLALDSTLQYIDKLKGELPDIQITKINSTGELLLHSHLTHMFMNWFYLQVLIQINGSNNLITLNEQLKLKDEQIKKLENSFVKKQKRTKYSDNVIYIVTTEANENERIYIVGKAEKLNNRLSQYNKTAEHTVVYYKSCPNEKTMGIVESMVLNELEPYRIQANRDRFELPKDQSISLFTNIIDKCVGFFVKPELSTDEISISIKTKLINKSPVEIEV